MTDEKERELVQQAKFYKDMCHYSYRLYDRARNNMDDARANWEDWRGRYEKADRGLAEIDGRLKVVTYRKKKERPAIVLTEEQILAIAEQLGIKIELPE